MNQKLISRSILLIISIYSLLVSCTKEVDYGSLVERNDIKYEVNSDKGYTGNSVGYHENGQKSIQCSFVDGKRHNSYQEWFENGQIKKDCTYSNGVLVGSYHEYYESGQIKTGGEFVEGLLNGDYHEFWGGGKKKYVGQYSMGKKNGEHLSINEDEIIFKRETFLDDSLHGESVSYWEDGSIHHTGSYLLGKKVGEHLEYFANKFLKSNMSYDSTGNKINGEHYFIYKGDTTRIVELYDGKNSIVDVKWYDMLGGLEMHRVDSTALGVNYRRERHYDEGKLFRDKLNDNNEWVYEYSDNGTLSRKYQWKDVEYNGRVYNYYSNGRLEISGFYKKHKKSGLWKWYYESGALKRSGTYSEGAHTGIWKWYDEEGNVTDTEGQ
jgi:uncharacterized protein